METESRTSQNYIFILLGVNYLFYTNISLKEDNILYGEEVSQAKNVLTAAALTYVAALATAIVNLLYYALRLLGNNRRR